MTERHTVYGATCAPSALATDKDSTCPRCGKPLAPEPPPPKRFSEKIKLRAKKILNVLAETLMAAVKKILTALWIAAIIWFAAFVFGADAEIESVLDSATIHFSQKERNPPTMSPEKIPSASPSARAATSHIIAGVRTVGLCAGFRKPAPRPGRHAGCGTGIVGNGAIMPMFSFPRNQRNSAMRTIYVSPEFPLNRRMRKAVRRGKLRVVREGGERLSLGGGMAIEARRAVRTFSSPLVCMADRGAEVGGNTGQTGKEIFSDSVKIESAKLPPLPRAVCESNLEAVRRLLSEGADVNAEDMHSLQPLHHSAMLAYANNPQNARQIAEELIKRGAKVNANGAGQNFTPLHAAAERNSCGVADILIQHGAEVDAKNASGQTPLFFTAEGDHCDMVKLLISHGADLNMKSANRFTPLHEAASQNALRTAELLLKHGADVNAQDNEAGVTPLHCAAVGGKHEMTKLLLKHGADVNARDNEAGTTPLHVAAHSNSCRVADILIQHGAKVDAKMFRGKRPSFLRRLVKPLISHGADLNTKSARGWTPLHAAVTGGAYEAAGLLLKHGADVNARDNETGMTPLHVAALEDDRHQVAELLLDCGASVSAKEKHGGAPLHTAVIGGVCRIAELLIKRGADVGATLENRAVTPLDMARSNNAWGMVALLARFDKAPRLESAGVLLGDKAVMEVAGIYVIANRRDGRVKVGKTGDFRSRFGQLRQECRSAGIPDLSPVALFPVNANRGEVELRAHKRLAGCRIAGEWFECSPDEAVRAVQDSL